MKYQSCSIRLIYIFVIIHFFSIDCIAEENLFHSSSNNEYVIGCGDVLEIVTWQEPNLTKEVSVRLDGKLTFPLVDDIIAAGRTPHELKVEIEKKLARYVEKPFVTVNLRISESQKFYILGEVVKTGEYPIIKKLTVLQAFALAGGFTEWASKKEILLFRNQGADTEIIRIDYKKILKGKDMGEIITIQADDTIVVP